MLAVKVFTEGVAGQIKDHLPPEFQDMECRVAEGQKNNGVVRVGISCRMPGNQTPFLIYMEPYYEMVRQGRPLINVMGMIAHEVEASNKIRFTVGETCMGTYEDAKPYLSVRLINTEANRKMLMDVPHMEMADLSAVCRVEIPVPGGKGLGSIQVTNDNLEQWGIGHEELFGSAIKNMQETNPPIMVDMEAALWAAISGTIPEQENLLEQRGSLEKQADNTEKQAGFLPMYVLTTRNKSNGAAVMMFPDVMEKVSGMFPEGFYILPASISEVIILPKVEEMGPKELGQMVRDINRRDVPGEEVLSDRVYEYDREQGRIHFVPESVERAKGVER